MNDSQSNRLDMYIVVNGLYLSNQPIIDAVPARATAFGALGANITAINTQVAGQSANTTGVTQDKAVLRSNLDNAASAVLTPTKAWAISVGNNTLVAEFNYSLSAIQQIKDDTMQGFCDHRIALVNDNIANLADFGILPANVTQWQDALNAYVAILETPREAINTKHLHTQNLKSLFSSTATLFKDQLDPLMSAFKTEDPELHAAYIQARIVINRRGPKKSNIPADAIVFGLYVFDELTFLPVQGAIFRVLNAPDGVVHQATVDSNGILELTISGYTPNMPALVQAEITADGYETSGGEGEGVPGQYYSIEVGLQPIVLPPSPQQPIP